MSMSERELACAAMNRALIAGEITAAEATARRRALDAGTDRPCRPPMDPFAAQIAAWTAADRADDTERRRRETERLMRDTPRRSLRVVPREDRIPRQYLETVPLRVTLTQARMLDLLACGATVAEVARIETVAPSTVRNTLARAYDVLGVRALASLAEAWIGWCLVAARPIDPAQDRALRLLRGQHLQVAGPLQLTDEQWSLASLLAGGLTTTGIAQSLGRSVATIERRLTLLYRAAGVRTRAGLVARYRQDRAQKRAWQEREETTHVV